MTATTASVRYRFARFELQPASAACSRAVSRFTSRPHAFDLLVALVEQSGHLGHQGRAAAQVWGKVIVEENTLQAHISALRKVLGAERSRRSPAEGTASPSTVTPWSRPRRRQGRRHNLPQALTSFIGREQRDHTGQAMAGHHATADAGRRRRLRQDTARAAGGGHALLDEYPDGVWFVELALWATRRSSPRPWRKPSASRSSRAGPCGDGGRMARIAAVADGAGQRRAPARSVRTARRACCCVAARNWPSSATSRERLGIEGELTYRVPSLAVAAARPDTTNDES